MKLKKIFIHKDAVVESTHTGEGTRIWRNVHVMPEAVIGENAIFGRGAILKTT